MFVGKSPEERELLGEEVGQGIPLDVIFNKRKRKAAWRALKKPFKGLFFRKKRRRTV